ncbi:hypothetical protein, variant [Blastomyces dermatitidis ATCC 26199]|nr:hypothetical protein BDFG_03812 [Blastomyces dermatitidis ATCC 26199]EQL34285.1 hypothetical protein, variant [Blastomyces dermatitidis ATCC 26199]
MFLKKNLTEEGSLPEHHSNSHRNHKHGEGRHTPHLRPYVDMVISAFQDRRFQRRTSVYQKRDLQDRVAKKKWTGPPSETIYGGISVRSSENNDIIIALAIRDTTYFLDFSEHHFPVDESFHPTADIITDFVIHELRKYEREHLEKFIGIALPHELAERCPHLCPRLWGELDIVPLVLHGKGVHSVGWINREYWNTKTLDEQAESVARKCITFFGPSKAPLLQVGYRGGVEVDCGFHAVLANLSDYELTVGSRTWNSVLKYADDLKKRKVKVAFFSATPQGGGVALMRHALVRFAETLGVDFKWYVPRPRPAVFRITKTNHNIFQGVSKPDERLTEENKAALTDWIVGNAKRYWFGKGGPLSAPCEGGADVIVIDDPQMPGLIPLIKEVTPMRPVIYRSHIQVRSDLIADPTTPQAEAWNYFWDSIKCADLFISHPVSSFVPHMVPRETVGYLPASTDWLDGLNKTMDDFDIGYYGRIFNAKCREIGMTTIDYPDDEYIVQIARFDPSKGIFDLLDAYEKFRILFGEKPAQRREASQAPDLRTRLCRRPGRRGNLRRRHRAHRQQPRPPQVLHLRHAHPALGSDPQRPPLQSARGPPTLHPRGLRGKSLRGPAQGQARHRHARRRHPAASAGRQKRLPRRSRRLRRRRAPPLQPLDGRRALLPPQQLGRGQRQRRGEHGRQRAVVAVSGQRGVEGQDRGAEREVD